MRDIIISEEEYRRAILRYLEVCDAEPDTEKYREAVKLTKLMELYEKMVDYDKQKCN